MLTKIIRKEKVDNKIIAEEILDFLQKKEKLKSLLNETIL